MRHGVDEELGTDALTLAHALAHAPQQLREDHPRVPPRPHQRAVPDSAADLVDSGPVQALELRDDGLEGQRHVRTRVPVGYRIDVEPVDVLLMEPESVPIALHDGAEIGRAEGRRGGHCRGC